MTTTSVMVVEDDPAFLARFCRIVAQSEALSLVAAVGDLASAPISAAGSSPQSRAASKAQAPWEVALVEDDVSAHDSSGVANRRLKPFRPARTAQEGQMSVYV